MSEEQVSTGFNIKSALHKAWTISTAGFAAIGLAFLSTALICGLIDWIPFNTVFLVSLLFWFCMLQIKNSWFYEKCFLPVGAIIGGLILVWMLIGKPGMNYFINNHTFLFYHLASGAKAAETKFASLTTGGGNASEAKRMFLDGVNQYEEKELPKEVGKLLAMKNFSGAAKAIAAHQQKIEEAKKIINGDNSTTSTNKTFGSSGKSENTTLPGIPMTANMSPYSFQPGNTYRMNTSSMKESGWIAFPTAKTSFYAIRPESKDYEVLYSTGESFKGNAHRPHLSGSDIKIKIRALNSNAPENIFIEIS